MNLDAGFLEDICETEEETLKRLASEPRDENQRAAPGAKKETTEVKP